MEEIRGWEDGVMMDFKEIGDDVTSYLRIEIIEYFLLKRHWSFWLQNKYFLHAPRVKN